MFVCGDYNMLRSAMLIRQTEANLDRSQPSTTLKSGKARKMSISLSVVSWGFNLLTILPWLPRPDLSFPHASLLSLYSPVGAITGVISLTLYVGPN